MHSVKYITNNTFGGMQKMTNFFSYGGKEDN